MTEQGTEQHEQDQNIGLAPFKDISKQSWQVLCYRDYSK